MQDETMGGPKTKRLLGTRRIGRMPKSARPKKTGARVGATGAERVPSEKELSDALRRYVKKRTEYK